MKVVKLVLGLFLFLLTGQLWAAGQDRGGGGGFCIEKKCFTLAEAGLRIPNQKAVVDWAPTVETLNELKEMERELPFGQESFTKRVINNLKTYVLIDRIDQKQFRNISNAYMLAMREANFQAPAQLEIFAVSSSGYDAKTYLLPSFFGLNARQQSLILIHEAHIREGKSLSEALLFDGALLDYLAYRDQLSFDPLPFYGALDAFLPEDYNQIIFWHLVQRMEIKTGRFLTLEDFLDSSEEDLLHLFKSGGADGKVGTLALMRSAAFESNFRPIFGIANIHLRVIGGVISGSRSYSLYPVAGIKDACAPYKYKVGTAKYTLIRLVDKVSIVAVDCTKPNGEEVYFGPAVLATQIQSVYGGIKL